MIPLLMGVTSYNGMNNIMDASTSISSNYARCLDMVGDFNADFQELRTCSAAGQNAEATAIANGAMASDIDVVRDCLTQRRDYEIAAVTIAAMNTNDLVEEISQISRQMEENSTISMQLKQESDRFVKL